MKISITFHRLPVIRWRYINFDSISLDIDGYIRVKIQDFLPFKKLWKMDKR